MSEERYLEGVQEFQEKQLQWKVQEIQNSAGTNLLPPSGFCHDCGEPFPKDDPQKNARKFCDKVCQEGWEEWFAAQKRKHGANFRPRSSFL